jgi:hypothetical protein
MIKNHKTSIETPASPADKIKKREELHRTRERNARILLRKVDITLKTEGVEAALKELMRVRLKTPLNSTIRNWLKDYRDMLDAWQIHLMPDVEDSFFSYGFRRARDKATLWAAKVKDERKMPYLLICDRVLEQMAERSRLAISDSEDEKPHCKPVKISLEDVSEEELSRGTQL